MRNKTSLSIYQNGKNKDYLNDSFHTAVTTRRKSHNNYFLQKKQRSLTNSVLDHDKKKLNESMEKTNKSIEIKKDKIQNDLTNSKVTQKNQNNNQNKSIVNQTQTIQAAPMRQNFFTPQKTDRSSQKKKCIVDSQDFHKTKSKLININFSHHNPELCVCADCTCGRHLCKMHIVKPDLRVSSIYNQDYYKKKPTGYLPLEHFEGGKKLEGPHLDMNTTYDKDYYPKKSQIQRPHPKDCLNVGGPSANLTSYSSGYPGHRGDNQYIKPTFNTHLNGILPFNGDSTYKNEFNKKGGKPSDLATWNDFWKPGQPWLGKTNYGESYKSPANHHYPQHVKIVQKRQINPDYDHQYQTIYRNDYLDKGNGVCPAKIKIESKRKGTYNNLKGNFNQNSDFKSMSPNYHAISTQKHSFV